MNKLSMHGWLHAARENIVGWYSTGPKIRGADLDINDLMSHYCDDPVLVICEVQVYSSLLWVSSWMQAFAAVSCLHVQRLPLWNCVHCIRTMTCLLCATGNTLNCECSVTPLFCKLCTMKGLPRTHTQACVDVEPPLRCLESGACAWGALVQLR
jgi:hypothetical protein